MIVHKKRVKLCFVTGFPESERTFEGVTDIWVDTIWVTIVDQIHCVTHGFRSSDVRSYVVEKVGEAELYRE